MTVVARRNQRGR